MMYIVIILITMGLTGALLYHVIYDDVNENTQAMPLGILVILVAANIITDNVYLGCLLIGVALPVCGTLFGFIIIGVIRYLIERLKG